MKAIILAAGYGTRMGDIAKNTPKPLLPVGGKAIIEYLLDTLSQIREINHYYIITNGKFYTAFKDWQIDFKAHRNGHVSTEVFNDQTQSNEQRLGAIGDIQFLLNSIDIREDVVISAGDNLYQVDVLNYYNYFKAKQTDCIGILPIEDREHLKRTGVVEINQDYQVVGFEEKPCEPKSNFACPPLYFLKAETLPLIETYIRDGHNSDAPGNFFNWLHRQKTVYAYPFKGSRMDVGNPKTYKLADQIYSEQAKQK